MTTHCHEPRPPLFARSQVGPTGDRECLPKPPHKPSNWWAHEREPWRRIRLLADAALARQKADRALTLAYANVGATLPAAGRLSKDALAAGLMLIGAVLPIAPEDES